MRAEFGVGRKEIPDVKFLISKKFFNCKQNLFRIR